MIVILLMMLLIIFVFISPTKRAFMSMMIASIVLSCLYFVYSPPIESDLFRWYGFLNYIKQLSFIHTFDGSYTAGNSLLRDVTGVNNVYLLFAWLISKTGINQLLPVLVGIVVYGLSAKRISRTSAELSSNCTAPAIAFAFLLLTLDFRSVSGIRNILAYAIFAYILYEDLVNDKNKVFCVIGYYIASQIHVSILVFITIRLLLLVLYRVNKVVLIIASLLAFHFLAFIQNLLSRLTQNAYISLFLYKTNRYVLRYGEGLAEYGYRRVASYLLLIMMYLFIYYIVKRSNSLPKKYDKYNLFYLSTIALTVGAIGQYDLFIRNCMLIVFLSLPYLVYALNYIVVVKWGVLYLYYGRDTSAITSPRWSSSIRKKS